jgi:hypothetical protein
MQRLGIVPRLQAALLSGDKRSTIRFEEPDIMPGRLAYRCERDGSPVAIVEVTRVTKMRLSEAAAFLGRSADWPPAVMLAGMREHYPRITLDDAVQVVEHTAPLA